MKQLEQTIAEAVFFIILAAFLSLFDFLFRSLTFEIFSGKIIAKNSLNIFFA